MAITVANASKFDKGLHASFMILQVTCDSSYPTGGYAFDPTLYGGFTSVGYVGIDGENGYNAQYDYANKKIKFYTSAGTETTNATNLSTVVLRIVVFGV